MTEIQQNEINEIILTLVVAFFANYESRNIDRPQGYDVVNGETIIPLLNEHSDIPLTFSLSESGEFDDIVLKIKMSVLLEHSDIFKLSGYENHTLCFTLSDIDEITIVDATLRVEIDNDDILDATTVLDQNLFCSSDVDMRYIMAYYFNLVNSD